MSTATVAPAKSKTDPIISKTEQPEPRAESKHISASCIHEYPDISKASEAAFMTANGTGGRVYPCTLFRQADRYMVVTSFPLNKLADRLATQAAERGMDPRVAQNRPVIPEHVKTIRDYLVQFYPNYVLPPLTVTYREGIDIYTGGSGPLRQGYLVIPDGRRAHITDGQHRYLAIVGYKGRPAIEGAIEKCGDLGEDSIAVQVTIENNMVRIHQDFADMANTKALPKSLLTAYNLRDPINRLVYEVIEGCPLLRGHVDETSKTLSKVARHVALSHWIRGLVKGAIATDYFVTDSAMKTCVRQELGGSEDEVTRLRDELVYLTNAMVANLPVLQEIAGIDLMKPEANKIPGLREQVLATTAVGLGIAGMLLRIIRMEIRDPEKRRPFINDIYAKVNWMRKAEEGAEIDPVWLQGGILDGGSIKSARGNIFTSTARIIQRLGLEVPERFQKALLRRTAKLTPGSPEALNEVGAVQEAAA